MIWPNQRLLDLLGIDLPIIQAPMAGLATSAMAAAVAEVGGLGSLGCAVLSADQIRAELSAIRRQTSKPINLNFSCHTSPATDPAREAAWRGRLKSYYVELGLDPEMPVSTLTFAPFGGAHCDLVAELKPKVVSFHFGLPNEDLLGRVKAAGATILSSATSVKEAIWLEQRGCDAIIAQGLEAGGHRGMFLSDNVATQAGTMALVPQVADAVGVPVIAAGGIAEERGIAAAFMLGASGVQMGTAYLFCPEANVSPLHRQALKTAQDDQTVLTNVLSGRAARAIVNRIVRELGPMAEHAPAFPLAGAALAPLRSRSEPSGSDDFTPLWSGQAARLGRELPAGELTVRLAKRALAKLGALQPAPDQPRKSPNRSAI
jgi:nitronate monooxygenase